MFADFKDDMRGKQHSFGLWRSGATGLVGPGSGDEAGGGGETAEWLAETPVDVIGGPWVDGVFEQLLGRPGFDDVARRVLGGEEERAILGDSLRVQLLY